MTAPDTKHSATPDKKALLNEAQNMIGDNLSFVASESYKRLRTNISFSFPKDDAYACKVVGITSSTSGEGKSLTAINTACSFAADGKRVLLVEGDLRKPTLAKRLLLESSPGLSNVLVGMSTLADAMRVYDKERYMYVLVAGSIPPNPSELLGSERMELLLNKMRESFDIIIVDLPPIGAVADALVISRLTDGMIVVARQNYTDRSDLVHTVSQLKFVGTKILGFVFNGVSAGASGYYSNRYYRKGYGRYGKGYGKDYASYGYGYGGK